MQKNTILEKLVNLEMLGWNAYMSAEYEFSSELFRQLAAISEKNQIDVLTVRAKFMRSECLKLLGLHKQALSEAMEGASSKYKEGSPRDVFNIYTNIISIGLSLPTSRKAIESSIEKADRFADQKGEPFWKAKTLLLKSNLFRNRGLYDKAIDFLKQAWSITTNSYPAYVNDTFMKNLVYLYLKKNELDKVADTFKKWEQLPNEQPARRKKRMILRLLQYLRQKGNTEKALELSRDFVTNYSDVIDSYPIIETLQINGFVEQSKSYLYKYLMHTRKAESNYQQKYNYLLLGDYYINSALTKIGENPVDLRFIPLNFKINSSKYDQKLLLKAQNAYSEALKYAKIIDELIESDINIKNVKSRLDIMNS